MSPLSVVWSSPDISPLPGRALLPGSFQKRRGAHRTASGAGSLPRRPTGPGACRSGRGGGAIAPDSQSTRGAAGSAGFGAAVAPGPACSAAARARGGRRACAAAPFPPCRSRRGVRAGLWRPWWGRGWRRCKVPPAAGEGSLSHKRSGSAACCWAVSHASLSSCLTGLVQELLKEEAPSRIAALTEELFQAAGSISEEDGSAAEVEPRPSGPAPLSSPSEETGLSCASRHRAALAQVGSCGSCSSARCALASHLMQ